MTERRLIVVAGPTASGKTALALALGKHFNAEIFSADARQFYRGMNIGTAKPSREEQAAIPHHFIDILDPEEDYTAGRFAKDLRSALEAYFSQSSTAILVGGSGFYIKAALEGIDELPESSTELRKKWTAIYEAEGIEGFQRRLQELDPDYYDVVDRENHQRLQRALEAMEHSGKTFSELRKDERTTIDANTACIWLNPPRDQLYERINKRVDEMMEAGLLEEVKRLEGKKDLNALQTVGYRELFEYLEGNHSLNYAIDKIKQHTRNYAKRQITWFRKQNNCTPIEEIEIESIIRHLEEVLNV